MRRFRTPSGLGTLLGCLCALAIATAPAQAVPPDAIDEALRVMCQRGLASSAADYCRAQANLMIEQAPPRARWVMRQMECQAQAALAADNANNDALWSAVAQTESAYRREHAEDPRLPWLAWQLARAHLLRGQQSLAQWLATPAGTAMRDQALQSVRLVHSQLDSVEQDIKERLPLSQPRAGNPTTRQAPSRELQELQVDCTLLRCEALLVRARCYPDRSTDRLAALADVDRTASAIMKVAGHDWPARDELLVAQAAAGLEIGKRVESMARLAATLRGQQPEPGFDTSQTTATPPPPPSPIARLRAGTALLEALVADDQLEQADQTLSLLRQQFSGPEVDLAALRVNIARMQAMPAANRSGTLKDILADVQTIGQQYGRYWQSRAEALLVAHAAAGQPSSPASTGGTANIHAATHTDSRSDSGNSSTSPSTNKSSGSTEGAAMDELLAIEVRQLIAGRQNTAAIARLTAAATASTASGNHDRALLYAMEAARLLQKEKQWRAAATLLLPLASAHPEIEGAAAAHALAAWCLAQALQSEGLDKEERKQLETDYETLLKDQLLKWPDADQTRKAEQYLAAWLAEHKRFQDLADMWAGRAQAAQATDRRVEALGQWLDTLLGRAPKSQVMPQLARMAKAINSGVMTDCERTSRIYCLAGALLSTPMTQAEAEAELELRMPGYVLEQSPADQSLLSALFALSATRQANLADAQSAANMLDASQLTYTLHLAWCKAMVEALDELPVVTPGPWGEVARRVNLPAGDTQSLTPALKMTALRLDQLQSAATQQWDENLDKIRQLAAQYANDPNLQLSYAAALAQSTSMGQGTRDPFADAVQIVKRVAVGVKKSSDTYLRARWLEARWRLGRGDAQSAAQVARLTLSSASIDIPWWKERFEKLSR